MSSKARRPAPKADPKPQPEPEPEALEPEALEAEAADALEGDPTAEFDVDALEPETKPEPEPDPKSVHVPSGMADVAKETVPAPAPDPTSIPVAETIVLNGAASYGPVTINGQLTRCRKGVPYHVPDVTERAAILTTGRFRGASKDDMARAEMSSAGPGGAITKDLLPPGAIKGGLINP